MSLLLALTGGAGPGTITGTLSITFDGQTVAGDGDLLINGVLAQSFGSMTLAGISDLDIVGQSSVTFAGQTLAGVGDLDITGALSITFGDMTAAADSDLIIQGTESGQMGDMTLTAVGQLNIAGVLAVTFGDMSLVGEGSSASVITGVSDISFDGMMLASTGELVVEAVPQPIRNEIVRQALVYPPWPKMKLKPITGSVNITFSDMTADLTATVKSQPDEIPLEVIMMFMAA